MAETSTTQTTGKGLLDYLAQVKDGRREQGREYPLASLLGMLLLGAINGETSLRGMWVWGRAHWETIREPLGFPAKEGRKPQYGTVWNALSKVSLEEVEGAVRQWWMGWHTEGEVLDMDEKKLRGSKRRPDKGGVSMVASALQKAGVVIAATMVEGGDSIEAALSLLKGLPLEGRVVTVDAGLHQRRVVECIVEAGGACLGQVKGNHGEFEEAVAVAVGEAVQHREPDVVQTEKRHGRIERRQYWWVKVDETLRKYFAKEYGWGDVRWCGVIRRRWRRLYESAWHEEERLWTFSARQDFPAPTAEGLSLWARGHWHIENRTFWVLDVTYQEDRNHARRIGPVLHLLRNMAINVIRRRGFRYVPDGRRTAAARPDRGLAWLRAP